MKLNKEIQIYRGIEDPAVYSTLVNLKNAVIYLDESIHSIDIKIAALAKSMDTLCSHVLAAHLKEVREDVLEKEEMVKHE